MTRRRRIVVAVAGAAVTLLVVLALGGSVSLELAVILLGLTQICTLVLAIGGGPRTHSRATVPAANVESRASVFTDDADGGLSVSAPASATPEIVPDAVAALQRKQRRAQEIQMIKDSLVFDREWYEAQTGSAFDSNDHAIADYLVRGNRTGYSPHPLFNPRGVRPKLSPGPDPISLLSYLRNEDGLWAAATSTLFDPAHLAIPLPADTFGPLTAFLRDRGSDAPLPYETDVAYLRPGLTLEEVRPFLLDQCAQWRAHEAILDLTRGAPEPPEASHEVGETQAGLVSIVVDGARSGPEVHAALTSLRKHLGGVAAEILILPASNSWTALQSISLAEFSTLNVRVLATVGAADRATLRINHGLHAARGEYVFVTTAQHLYSDGSVADLVAALNQSDAAAVHPVVLDEKWLISDAGVVYGTRGRDPIALLEGLPSDWADWSSTNVEVPGATLPLLMRASTVRSLRGFDPRLKQLWVDVDASQRAARLENKPVVVRTDNVVQLHGPSELAPRKGSEQDVRMFASLWPEPPAGSAEAIEAAGASATFEGFTSISAPQNPSLWSRARWRPRDIRAVEVMDRPERPLHWSIKTAAPASASAVSWGDFHFAQALATALRSLGQRVSVDYGTNAARASANADDVVLTLRGLKSVPLPAEATSLIWVISHPDEVTAQELSAYDLRYAASASWPQLMADEWGLEIAAMLQCTDPERFYIEDEPVPEVKGGLLMVGNSRGQYRPAATSAANAGLPVAIYGHGWEDFVSEESIAGSYVPNEELRRYYRSAEWALNDHWPDMRDHGFISNRVFDVFASGGRLLTDDVAGLHDLFPKDILPNGVATFSSPLELLRIVEAGPAAHYPDGSIQAISDHVRKLHSFEARAKVLLEDVRQHRAREGTDATDRR